jgi:hypothetical protein
MTAEGDPAPRGDLEDDRGVPTYPPDGVLITSRPGFGLDGMAVGAYNP